MSSEAPAVALCIINFNGAAHLRSALEAAASQSWQFAEILLIDNASTDDSVVQALSAEPTLRVVRLPSNGGPAAARNAGLRAAACDLILFQDNDIQLGPDTARSLIGLARMHPRAYVVAPRVVHASDPGRVQFDSADCHYLGSMSTRNAERPCCQLDNRPVRTTSMVSACFLLNRAVGDVAFDETLGFNLEDHDFGIRAHLSGNELWVQPEAVVTHGSGTPGLSYRIGGEPSSQRLYYLTTNRWIIVLKCFSTRTLLVLLPLLLAYELAQFVWLVADGRIAVWWRAVRTLFARRGALRESRRRIQATRVVGDRSLLCDGPLPLTHYVRKGFLARHALPVMEAILRRYWFVAQRWL